MLCAIKFDVFIVLVHHTLLNHEQTSSVNEVILLQLGAPVDDTSFARVVTLSFERRDPLFLMRVLGILNHQESLILHFPKPCHDYAALGTCLET